MNQQRVLYANEKAELSTRARKALSPSQFACPEKRKYPIHDAAHVRNALARIGDPSNDQCGRAKILAAARRFGIRVEGARAKALMPVQAKALAPDELDPFLEGKIPWRVLAVPFGGPIPAPNAPLGVDFDGQWFSQRTDIYGGYAALKASRERLVDWHHSYNPIGRGGDPTGVMSGVALGKAVLDLEPDDHGRWADFWIRAGQAKLAKLRDLLARGQQLWGSAQPTHPDDTLVDRDSGEILRFPLLLETITTSPQNHYAVVRPKAVLDDLESVEIAVSPALRDLLTELDALGAEFPSSFRGHGGETAAKAGGVLSLAAERALDDALDAWSEIVRPPR